MNPTPLTKLLFAATLALGCSEAPQVPTAPLFEAGRAARVQGDWEAAGEHFEAALQASLAAQDSLGAELARRGVLQARAAKDPAGALEAARAWLEELGPTASVDLYGGLATDFKLAAAPAAGLVICELGLAAHPGDVGLQNAEQRLRSALPP
ncbi:MAG: hypothetical protein OEY14_18765, partial [Myxococcales bacterium]|nr:hypothetical protein [Myxococcales bacterium]